MDNLQTVLTNCANQKKLVEIYTDKEDSFSVGIPLYLDKNGLLVSSINTQGKTDGCAYYSFAIIEKVETETEYLQKLTYYQDFWREQGNATLFPLKEGAFEPPAGQNLLWHILNQQQNARHIITIENDRTGELETGFLVVLTEESLVLQTIDLSNAKFMGKIQLSLHTIHFVEFNSMDHHLLEYANHCLEMQKIRTKPVSHR
ncbi:hypothetical protein [Clostridium minihomine]|uniref:hypothetical protein n=1 Tax=Clostridium minihomine TaxID=2045012 RepID=UPI000C77099F|nr:hypothetical protein [Clostridium minihomine]